MDLREFLGGRDNKERKLYWALVVESDWVQAGIWEIVSDKAEVISISPPAAWEMDSELIGAADTALSAAIQNLPEDVAEPVKTVFGVPPTWVVKGEIKEEYLEKIKNICTELSLDPAGFVVIPEAIAHLVKSEEGAPLNSVVIGLGGENLEIAVFRLGSLVGMSTVARSISVADDVSEGLSRFSTEEPLPSRFIIYDGKEGELEEVRQSLMNAQWEEYEKIKFLHTPKIEILSPERKVTATALAGASEMGQVSAVLMKDKKQPPQGTGEEIENVTTPEKPMAPEDLGFVVGQDISESQKTHEPQKPYPQAPEGGLPPHAPMAGQFPAKQETPQPSAGGGFARPGVLTKVAGLFGRLSGGLRGSSRFSGSEGKKTFTYGGIFLGVALLVGFILWWFLSQATVTIYISPKKSEEKMDVEVNLRASNFDFSRKVLPGERIETRVSGEKTKATTGSKKVGERARGSVKIQNGTSVNITLAAGTVLVSANDLRFTLNDSVSVSAALSPLTPGTANVEVSSADIGAEYNLAKDEVFSVGNYPKAEVDAVSTADFTGGSSRDISAVSAEDQSELEEDLTQELKLKAQNELAQGVSGDQVFVEGAVFSEVVSRTFSNKVGDEASSLKLSLEVGVSGIVIPKPALLEFAKQMLENKVPSGYVLRETQLDFGFEFVEQTGSVYLMEMTTIANFLPDIDSNEIAKNIKGKYPTHAKEYLSTIPGFSRANIEIKPKLPDRINSLPRLTKNIHIDVAAER